VEGLPVGHPVWDVDQWGGIGVGASVGLVTTNGHVGRSQVRFWHPSGESMDNEGAMAIGAVGLAATCIKDQVTK